MAFSIFKIVCLLATCIGFLQTVIAAPEKGSLPIVDLGYELHQAAFYNDTGHFYNFSNIRYAAPPVADLRFRAPQPPAQNRGQVQTGSQGRICAQAVPDWLVTIAPDFVALYLAGQRQFNHSSFNTTVPPTPVDPRTTEDCLFLDVVVPKKVFDNAGKSKGAAVLVWIYGGGYTIGNKNGNGSPAGLIKRSLDHQGEGVIYVTLNYRLGAFGWLSGPTFQQDGTANAGLHDQRFALEWVQEHIAKFGGDPSRVTLFGESAGGGSTMHQITAYGGEKPVPFSQALPQSPGFPLLYTKTQQEHIFNDYLSILGVSTIEEARKMSFDQLQAANVKQVGASVYGWFVYGPAVDGDFVPALAGQLLQQGRFAKDLKVMVGHNTDEGLLFTSPFVQSNDAFRKKVIYSIPSVRRHPNILRYITHTLYPPVFDGSQAQGYTDQISRYDAFNSEEIFTCNTFYLDKAFNNQTYSYLFSVPPGIHGEDVPYTYYNGPNPAAVPNPAIAIALQEYITNFAMTGDPNGPGVPHFPMYGADATVQDLNYTGITQTKDPAANYRCAWWQSAPYE